MTVIESHPDNALEDLRLDKPFPELREHFQSYDLEHMDKKVGGLRVCECKRVRERDLKFRVKLPFFNQSLEE